MNGLAAVDAGEAEATVAGDGRDFGEHLLGKLAGWGEDDGLDEAVAAVEHLG